jgi:hypothetical protein
MKTDTPETDAVREMWFITPNVSLGDGRPIHANVVDVEFARQMERQRDQLRAELKRLMEWDNFPPGYADRDRALALISQHNSVLTQPDIL